MGYTPYSDVLRNVDGTNEFRDDVETSNKWESHIVEDPVSDELKALIRADLKRAWHFNRHQNFREDLRMLWTIPIDSYQLLLQDDFGMLYPHQVTQLCNKPTSFYWFQSAQSTNCYGERRIMPRMTIAGIYEEWWRCNDGQPDIEYGHFFANQVRITSTGPSLITKVLAAHASLCSQASSMLNDAKEGVTDNVVRHPETLKHYTLLPLYRAIVVMIDRVDYRDKGVQDLKTEEGKPCVRKYLHSQSVLLVRTGDEDGLSARISFDGLKERALPLDRPDMDLSDTEVIRVPLDVAVLFISILEKREEATFPKPGNHDCLERHLCPFLSAGMDWDDHVLINPDAWVNAHMEFAETHGWNEQFAETSRAIRRVKAAMVGEYYHEFIPPPFIDSWS